MIDAPALAMLLDAADRHAAQVAIEEADGTAVTYAELVDRARSYTRELARTGDAAAVVEVAAVRGADFVARCLGAWLAGRAFFPVDPADPRARPRIAEPRLAYVIATSGSTGAPKLVMVGHRGLPALLRTQIDAFALGPGARSLWLHAPMFDASISDWGTALASGATLVIPTAAAVASAAALRGELAVRAITHVDLPPALLGYIDPLPPALRVVVLGGEACPVDRVRALARRVRVVVVYGPTEATVCSSLVVVDPERWERPLIGTPLPGITYRVIGGELHIAGADALAVGYAHDPDETARRFVTVDGLRLYRTGDRVEPCAGGLAFVGRVDRQCKIAGRRVELDAIEAVLRRHVAEAAVVARGSRLVAFVSAAIDRDALRAELPAWMIPSRVVVDDAPLPRTSTGKLDRSALAARELPIVVPFADPFERALAVAWCTVLGVARVDRDHRFSHAGGDSLARLMFHAATDVVISGDPTFDELGEQARAGVDIDMPVGEAEARGLAMLAERLAGARGEALERVPTGPEVVEVERAGAAPPRASSTEAACASRSRCSGAGGHRDAIFMTGATGFLGRALVAAWRRHDPGRRLVALVRDPSRVDVRDDVELVSGDVARPYFGLDRDAWEVLRARVAAVVHGAAVVRLGGTWDDHAAVNVGGTAEVARFVGDNGAIAWHHISTLSVFASTDRARGLHLPAALPAGLAFGGYAQSKIAAEAIARARRATTIFRLGLLVGAGDRGQLPMTIRGLAKLGCVPAGTRALRLDTTPVAYAADAIVRRALAAAPGACVVHHVASPRGMTCGELADGLRAVGVALAEVGAAEWQARAHARVDDPEIAMTVAAFSGRRDRALFLATGADFGIDDRDVPALDVVGAALAEDA